MGETRKTYKILTGYLEGNGPFGKSKRKGDFDIKMVFK
jgi:hypothetical protein